MKKYFFKLICFLFTFSVICTPSHSATLSDVAGSYNVTIDAKVKVKGVGKDKSTNLGVLTLYSNGTFLLNDSSTSNDPDGTIWMDSKGKKVLFNLSNNGRAALEATLVDWLTDALLYYEGISITNVDFEFPNEKTGKVKIDKNTNSPKGKAKVKIKGTVSGDIPGEGRQTTKFAYQAKIIFQ